MIKEYTLITPKELCELLNQNQNRLKSIKIVPKGTQTDESYTIQPFDEVSCDLYSNIVFRDYTDTFRIVVVGVPEQLIYNSLNKTYVLKMFNDDTQYIIE